MPAVLDSLHETDTILRIGNPQNLYPRFCLLTREIRIRWDHKRLNNATKDAFSQN